MSLYIFIVGRVPKCIFFAYMAVALPGAWAQTSQSPPPPSPPPQDEPRGYIPQGPAKCVEVGNFYLRKKNYYGALSRFEEAAKDDPTYAAAFLGLGKVYEKIGLKQKALVAYKKYLDELPSEKQADDKKSVQRAVARLEKELGTAGAGRAKASSPGQSPSSH